MHRLLSWHWIDLNDLTHLTVSFQCPKQPSNSRTNSEIPGQPARNKRSHFEHTEAARESVRNLVSIKHRPSSSAIYRARWPWLWSSRKKAQCKTRNCLICSLEQQLPTAPNKHTRNNINKTENRSRNDEVCVLHEPVRCSDFGMRALKVNLRLQYYK